jgi:hypothetical protein
MWGYLKVDLDRVCSQADINPLNTTGNYMYHLF